jgi:DNA-binding transcriptional LysR family regulator
VTQPFLELAALWPYLPHFRVVAEYESLSKASRRFGLSPAALSKAIRTLERTLALELFDRAGGKLRLNDHGRTLLGAIRAAMRDIDDAIAAARGAPTAHALRVALDSAWGGLVLPADSTSDTELVDVPANVVRTLLRGDADIVFHGDPLSHAELDTQLVATFPRAVCVATRHRASARDELAFVAIRSGDGWPSHVARRCTLTATTLAHALAAAATGACAVVAPVALAPRFGLRALDTDPGIAPLTLWATIRRSRGGAPSSAQRFRELARAHCGGQVSDGR